MQANRIAVVVPVFGLDYLTHALLGDVFSEADLVDAYVVDNGGDYAPYADEYVLRPGSNLGWLRGSNFGLAEAIERRSYGGFALLNNDTRLSPRFFAGLRQAATRRVGLVGPLYDDWWPHQLADYRGAAADYTPSRRVRRVPFVDGTCMYLTGEAVRRVGFLDETHFSQTGWGAELDYAYRVRRAGLTVVVTEASYLNHIRRATADVVYDDYGERGGLDFARVEEKWGPNWRRLTGLQPSGVRHQTRRVLRALKRRLGLANRSG